ncbi:MAG TPA: tagatose-bisphosphate aldolase [Eubacteriaceae bacterium]|nr:tagatose-bisphosphate aldolase [Eubacteriaceae bacterium]
MAAEDLKSPVILQTDDEDLEYGGMEYLSDLALGAARRSQVPVAFHLDRVSEYETALKSFRWGYSGMTVDCMGYNFEESIQRVNEIGVVAKALKVYVEICMQCFDENIKNHTDIEKAREFCENTICDGIVAVADTSHESYKGEVKIDFGHLKKMDQHLDIPIVLSEVSNVPNDQISKAVKSGIRKVNFNKELKEANKEGLGEFLFEHPHIIDMKTIYQPGRDKMYKVATEKIRACHSNNRV